MLRKVSTLGAVIFIVKQLSAFSSPRRFHFVSGDQQWLVKPRFHHCRQDLGLQALNWTGQEFTARCSCREEGVLGFCVTIVVIANFTVGTSGK